MKHRIRYNILSVGVCNTSGNGLREPSVRVMLLRFADFTITHFPEVFKNIVDAGEVTYGGLATDPINYDGPFKRIKVTVRLGKDLVGSGRRASCDKTR